MARHHTRERIIEPARRIADQHIHIAAFVKGLDLVSRRAGTPQSGRERQSDQTEA